MKLTDSLQPHRRPTWVVCLPQDLWHVAIKHSHETGGHMGIDATLHRLQRSVFFPSMRKEVAFWIQTCKECATKNKPSGGPQKHTLVSPVEGYPFQRLSIDFVGPMTPSKKGTVISSLCVTLSPSGSRLFLSDSIVPLMSLILLSRRFSAGTGSLSRFIRTADLTLQPPWYAKLLPLSTSVSPLRPRTTQKPTLLNACIAPWGPSSGRCARTTTGPGQTFSLWRSLPSTPPSAALQASHLIRHFSVVIPDTPLDLIFPGPPEELPAEEPAHLDYVLRLRRRMQDAHGLIRRNIASSVIRQRRLYHAQTNASCPATKSGSSPHVRCQASVAS